MKEAHLCVFVSVVGRFVRIVVVARSVGVVAGVGLVAVGVDAAAVRVGVCFVLGIGCNDALC